jgi:hypothetical protein
VFIDGGAASDGYVSDILRLVGGAAVRRLRGPGWRDLAAEAVESGTVAGVQAIVLWIVDPAVPAVAVGRAARCH